VEDHHDVVMLRGRKRVIADSEGLNSLGYTLTEGKGSSDPRTSVRLVFLLKTDFESRRNARA